LSGIYHEAAVLIELSRRAVFALQSAKAVVAAFVISAFKTDNYMLDTVFRAVISYVVFS
jgi:hypothetical protein